MLIVELVSIYEDCIDGLITRTILLIEPKIDVCTIAIKYKDGKNSKAINS